LTAAAIESTGLDLAGWVANCLPPPADATDENINSLKSMLSAPLLGIVPVLTEVSAALIAPCLALPEA
jgi:dethiobiotin synthetase